MNDPVFFINRLQAEARDLGLLTMWTIYDHPSDYPEHWVARCHVSGAGGSSPTVHTIRGKTLRVLQLVMRQAGLTPLPRDETDDAKIVETWL